MPADKHPRQQLLERYCRVEAKTLRARLPQGVGFALQIFDFGEREFLAYISNAKREHMIATLRELIEHLEKGQR